ncbi:MAG TPA: hypothetical protein DCL21_04655 [Alphaproteobacteria bacterium]|nr:hypothetical protein [Alphaproteobacteria bacterium]
MDRIQHERASATRPNYTPSGTKGFAVGFDSVTGKKGTPNLAAQYNSMQETLMHTIETAGLQGDHADDSQLTKAVQKVANEQATEALSTKADKMAEPIATAEFGKVITRVSAGIYEIYLDDKHKGSEFDVIGSTTSWSITRYSAKNFVEGSFQFQVVSIQTQRYLDSTSTVRVYKRKDNV